MAKRNLSLERRRNRETGRPEAMGEGKHRPTLVAPQVVETDFAELEDGSIVELIEDPDLSSKTLLAVYKGGSVRYVREVKATKTILVPLPRESEFVRNMRLPRGVEPYESVKSLLTQLCAMIRRCVDLDEMLIFLLGNFVLSSWVVERLKVAPYVAITGLPGTGKTTLLKILSLLCRRPILTADISSAAFYGICDRLTPTLLIDELNTAEQRRSLLHLLRAGSTPGFTVFRKNQSFRVYGARVVSWIELPNDPGLNSRCIVVPLQESKRNDLKMTTDPEIQEAADRLQRQLLMYRLDKLNSLTLPRVDGDDRLRGRTRDLYEALARANGDPAICESLVKTFEILEEENREALSPAQTAVLRTLFSLIHSSQYYDDNQSTFVGDVAGFVNHTLESRGERLRLTARAVGPILRLFGIPTSRNSWGTRVWLDRQQEERIHNLAFRYGLDNSFGERDLSDPYYGLDIPRDRRHLLNYGPDSKPDLSESASPYRLQIVRTYDTCQSCRALHRRDFETKRPL